MTEDENAKKNKRKGQERRERGKGKVVPVLN
jgi:hypothetical protein